MHVHLYPYICVCTFEALKQHWRLSSSLSIFHSPHLAIVPSEIEVSHTAYSIQNAAVEWRMHLVGIVSQIWQVELRFLMEFCTQVTLHWIRLLLYYVTSSSWQIFSISLSLKNTYKQTHTHIYTNFAPFQCKLSYKIIIVIIMILQMWHCGIDFVAIVRCMRIFMAWIWYIYCRHHRRRRRRRRHRQNLMCIVSR